LAQVLVVVFLLLSAWLATKFFSETTPEFMDFNTSLLNLFVLLTTANNPVVWASVYAANRMAFFFFFTYMIVGLFFLMNLAFSVIYSNYKAQVHHHTCTCAYLYALHMAACFQMYSRNCLILSFMDSQMAVEVAKRTTARQGNLRAAFSLLDTREQEWIDGATMISLFLIIGRYRSVSGIDWRLYISSEL
jgi:two pore calcium channel protein